MTMTMMTLTDNGDDEDHNNYDCNERWNDVDDDDHNDVSF